MYSGRGSKSFLAILCILFIGCGSTYNNGSTPSTRDDTARVQQMIDAGQTIPAGQYVLRRSVIVTRNVVGVGPATHFTFIPTLPQMECQNDRAFTTPCDTMYDKSQQAYKPRRRIATPIEKGDTSIQTVDDASDLAPGDWLIITERDSQVRDVVIIDWMQVASASGHTVTFTAPFRMAFPNTHAWDPIYTGLGFLNAVNTARNISLRDFSLDVINNDPNDGTGAISIFAAQHISVSGLVLSNPTGQALYSYISNDVTFSNCTAYSGTALSEFAATTDLQISNNQFSSAGDVGFGLDLGSGYFTVSTNSSQGFGSGFYMLYGVHDGTVQDLQIPYVNASGNATGILARGTQNVRVINNNLLGGAGTQSIAISFGPADQLEIPLRSYGNVAAPNTFGPGWAMDYDPTNQL